MRQRVKVSDIKDMGLPYIEKIYCFMLDIEERSQASNSDDVILNIVSPNAIRFPAIMHIMSHYQETDWREGPIKDLVAWGIINCRGVNIPLANYPGAQNFEGIDLIIRDRSKFTSLLKKVEAAYKSKSADGQRIDIKSTHLKHDTATKNQPKIPLISKNEKMKYGNRYPRKDVIKFLNREGDNRNYIIEVNEEEVPVPYALYLLLLFLAIKLKTDMDDGWATIKELEAGEIVNETNIHHLHQLTSNLNNRLRPFIESNTKELIQNMKRASKYRLSTMPSRIKTPHADLPPN